MNKCPFHYSLRQNRPRRESFSFAALKTRLVWCFTPNTDHGGSSTQTHRELHYDKQVDCGGVTAHNTFQQLCPDSCRTGKKSFLLLIVTRDAADTDNSGEGSVQLLFTFFKHPPSPFGGQPSERSFISALNPKQER